MGVIATPHLKYLLTRRLSTVSLVIQVAAESMNMDDRRLGLLIACGDL